MAIGKTYKGTITKTATQFVMTIPREIATELNLQKKERIRIFVDQKTKNIIIERIGGLVE